MANNTVAYSHLVTIDDDSTRRLQRAKMANTATMASSSVRLAPLLRVNTGSSSSNSSSNAARLVLPPRWLSQQSKLLSTRPLTTQQRPQWQPISTSPPTLPIASGPLLSSSLRSSLLSQRLALPATRHASTSSSSQSQGSSSSSTSSSSSSQEGDADPNEDPNARPSIRQRLRYLWKRYGWWSIAVYNIWGLVDFSITFSLIHWIGADYVREIEESIRSYIGMGKREATDEEVASWPLGNQNPALVEGPRGDQESGPLKGENNREAAKMAADRLEKGIDEETAAKGTANIGKGASGKHGSGSSSSSGQLWAEAVLAYTIHKTLWLPIRVAGTGFVTPSFVRLMVRLGWAKPLPPPGTVAGAANVASSASSLGSSGAQKAAKEGLGASVKH